LVGIGSEDKMKVIGLTGGIGGGKSSVLREFKLNGAAVLDTDALSREVVNPLTAQGKKTLQNIAQCFGPQSISGHQLNRTYLKELIAQDQEFQKKLEAITHPEILFLVQEFLKEQFQNGTAICVIEGTRLVESGFAKDLDALVMVESPLESRITRVMERDHIERAFVERLISIQNLSTMRSAAQYFIHNDSDLNHIKSQVEELIKKLSVNNTKEIK